MSWLVLRIWFRIHLVGRKKEVESAKFVKIVFETLKLDKTLTNIRNYKQNVYLLKRASFDEEIYQVIGWGISFLFHKNDEEEKLRWIGKTLFMQMFLWKLPTIVVISYHIISEQNRLPFYWNIDFDIQEQALESFKHCKELNHK